jgi:hypothetical protein
MAPGSKKRHFSRAWLGQKLGDLEIFIEPIACSTQCIQKKKWRFS